MCYPKNSIRRHELHAALVAEYYLRVSEDPVAWSRPLSSEDLRPLLKARHEGRSFKEVVRTMRDTNQKGALAGAVLLMIRWVSAHGHQGSVLKACYIHAELAKRAKAIKGTAVTVGVTEITHSTTQGTMEKAWSPYKTVAHFWAAYNVMRNQYMERDAEGVIVPPVDRWFEDTDAFLKFLAIAENFRRFGESYIPRPAAEPVLAAHSTWRVPEHVHLPDVGPFEPPPLLPEIRDALKSYRA